ncbi:MAG TPA: MarR family transcriptional regulator [Acidobacteriaceae bacterium]|nr:MarR family transcriptional regulator [Acidobacteriaceae bacterium]
MSTKKSTAAALVHQLRHFIAGVILYNQRVAEQVGMNPTDMQCIHLLELMGPLTPGKLAECTGLTTGGVTVVLDRLEKAGHVRREPNPQDRRSIVVHLQPGTLEEMAAHYAAINKQMDAFLAAYPERKLETVAEFLTKINTIRTPAAPKRPRKAAKASK